MTVSYLAQGRFSKPYLVIWHPLTRQGAWYDRRFRLRACELSDELLAFAREHACSAHPWNDLQRHRAARLGAAGRHGRLRVLLAVRRRFLLRRPGQDSARVAQQLAWSLHGRPNLPPS